MGFTTGFIGGITLTTGVLYLTLHAHRQNRTRQSLALRQQTLLLGDVVDPRASVTEASESILRAPLAERQHRADVVELAKDRWNRELETLVRRAADFDWGAARENAEDVGRAVWRSLRSAVDKNS